MKGKSVISLLAALAICGLPAALAEKEENVYAVLSESGGVNEVYVVNQFTAGRVVDYGDYSDVRLLRGNAELTLADGRVSFRAGEDRDAYQGELTGAELPWCFDLAYTLNGRALPAHRVAGEEGQLTLRLSIRKNDRAEGPFFDTHALRVVIALDLACCAEISAPGAAWESAGDQLLLTYILSPGTETELTVNMTVSDFRLPPMTITALRAASVSAAESTDGAALRTQAEQLLEHHIQQANATLQAQAKALEQLNVTVPTLTRENYDTALTTLRAAFLDGVDDAVYAQADAALEQQVSSAVREEMLRQARQAARGEVRSAVEDAAAAQIRQQILAAAAHPSDELVNSQVAQQMGSEAVQARIEEETDRQMKSDAVQAEITAQLTAQVCPAVEAAVRAQVLAQVKEKAESALRLAGRLELTHENGEEPTPEEVEAEVARRMQSAEVQAGIETAVEMAMKTNTVQQMISAEVEKQLQDETIRAQAEAAARPQVRAQVAAAVEAEVRKQVVSALSSLTEAQVDALVAEQLQSAEVQEQIRVETASQLDYGQVARQLENEVDRQLQTPQMQGMIAQQMAVQSSGDAYQQRVSQALGQGEKNEAYQLLVNLQADLRETAALLESVNAYVSADADTSAAWNGAGAASEEEVSFVDERNADVRRVQFHLTTRALEAEAAEEEAPVEVKKTFWDRVLDLFR